MSGIPGRDFDVRSGLFKGAIRKAEHGCEKMPLESQFLDIVDRGDKSLMNKSDHLSWLFFGNGN